MPTVVVTDYRFASLDLEREIVESAGFDFLPGQCPTPDDLVPFVRNADAVITQFSPINASVIQAMEKAKVIVRYGIGVDNVDLAAARAKGIPVCNIPDYCIDEVADHTLSFILATTRQVVPNTLHVRSGNWGLATSLDQMRTLKDLTIGIVGFGRIGREVASRLAPFKCQRLVCDQFIPPAVVEQAGCRNVTLDQLLSECDVITLHCPSTAETRKLLNTQSIAKMKRGSILVNLGRGDLIDTTALINALQSGQLSAAAIDVCDPEPIPLDSPLRTMPNVITASHIASTSPKAVRKLQQSAAQLAVMALQGKPLPSIVN
ncbi:MAG: C-terminal binding protein [Pirellulales bacterium]